MQIHRRRFIETVSRVAAGAGFVPALSALGCAPSPAPESTRPESTESEWKSLFDGVSLNGWHINPEKIGHGTGGQWAVEDGTITGQQDPPGSGNGGILLTDEKFMDFELTIDIKPDWGVCSGLFLRSNDKGQCIQMMVDYHDNGKMGFLYGEGTFGFNCATFEVNGVLDQDQRLVRLTPIGGRSLEEAGLVSSCTPEEFIEAYKIDDWNTARVLITGTEPHITTWINGLKICEFDGPTTTNQKYVDNRQEIVNRVGQPGSIAVQVHGGKGWPTGAKCRWKNIRIRPV